MANAVETPDVAGARSIAAVSKSDSTVVNCRALYVGGAGDVAIKTHDGATAVTFTAVPAGALLPVRCYHVMSTNTTATAMVAIF